jgi:hypothetical protein
LNYALDDIDPSPELLGTILTDQGNYINYEFEHPLYPYQDSKFANINNCNFGLFKILSNENSIFKSIKQPFRGNNPYNFGTLNGNTMINTPHIIYNETLMWVNLNPNVVSIKLAVNKLKLLQEKAVDTFTKLPYDMKKSEINTYLGGKKKRTTRRKHKKNYKNNSKRRK